MCLKNKRSDVRKIYKTNDGFLDGKEHIRKPRNVAVYKQRDDGAVALVKIFSEEDKNLNSKVKNVVLKPIKGRASITRKSVFENKVIVGRKIKKNGSFSHVVFYPRDFEHTNDKLTRFEFYLLKRNLQNNNKLQRRKHRSKIRKWKRHFK